MKCTNGNSFKCKNVVDLCEIKSSDAELEEESLKSTHPLVRSGWTLLHTQYLSKMKEPKCAVNCKILPDDQCIVKVVEVCDGDHVCILTPKGYKHFVSISKITEEQMTIVPGSYVLIQATDNSRYPAEVIQVIDSDLERFYRSNKLWPAPYDAAGCVELLAEKIEIQNKSQQIAKLKTEIKNLRKNSPKKVSSLNNKSSQMNKYGKKSEPIPTTSCNNEITKANKPKIMTSCNTCNPICTSKPLSTTSTESNTEKVILRKTLNVSSRSNSNISGTCESCNSSCMSFTSKRSVGSGPNYSIITVDRDRLPPLYGTCTPWRATKKELKKAKKKSEEKVYKIQ